MKIGKIKREPRRNIVNARLVRLREKENAIVSEIDRHDTEIERLRSEIDRILRDLARDLDEEVPADLSLFRGRICLEDETIEGIEKLAKEEDK